MVRLMGQLFQCIVGEALEPPAKNATHFWISEGNIILLPYGNVILLCKITGRLKSLPYSSCWKNKNFALHSPLSALC